MALVIQPQLLSRGTMRERDVVVSDIVEEVDLLFLQHQPGRDGVHRRIAPSLVEEPAVPIQMVEVIHVGGTAQPVQIADLEIGPEVAVVVALAAVVGEEREAVVRDDVLRVGFHEALDRVPERGDRLDVLVEGEDEGVFLLVIGHKLERVIFDVAEELDGGFHAPVPLVFLH